MDAKEFVKVVNNIRLSNKDKWYTFVGEVEGKQVSLKAYGTWLQVFRVNEVSYANCMERTITEFKGDLAAPFKS